MIKPKLLHDNLQSNEEYNNLFDKIVKEETDWWTQQFDNKAINPSDKDLQKMKDIAKKTRKDKEYTDADIKEEHARFMQFGGIVVSTSIKKVWEEKRIKTIKKWKKEARERNKKILSAIPFDNIKCKKCTTPLEYRWSMLHEETAKDISKVLFFYFCPNECGNNQLIFEDGTPWISESNNNCAICNGKRDSTVTKDNSGKTYVIFECKKCGSRQVEKYENQ